jgi:hypothetical protein
VAPSRERASFDFVSRIDIARATGPTAVTVDSSATHARAFMRALSPGTRRYVQSTEFAV